ncbi:hypothetical protein SISNIDRAFT_546844 [Sistotremastrum niveocremeum HHB9708]|uniref:CUE domain-containing protein n=1 Tax=Sistotremastrum niveocremeum HHB9708 TaxID=1314777 RepID=A0A164ZJT8_9AGAM|nr:hypothetical protein SISNIDRAFT_546844 [Sistotremastrum niveocremeum HHB9708]
MASFHHAPVSKGLMLSVGAFSLIFSLFDIKHYIHLQYWRLLIHQLACGTSGDLLLTEILLFTAAIEVERQFGSLKFASFVFVSTALSATLLFAALLLFHGLSLNTVPPGPFALVFAILYQYHRLVPSSYDYRIFLVTFSNKSHIYLLATQLMISGMPGSVVASLVGLLASQLYNSDIVGLKVYRLPGWAQRLATRYLTPLIGSTRAPRRSNLAIPEPVNVTLPSTENTEVITTSTAPPAEAPEAPTTGTSVVREWMNELTGRRGLREPSATEIEEVIGMFPDVPRQSVIVALRQTPNTESAVEILLRANER